MKRALIVDGIAMAVVRVDPYSIFNPNYAAQFVEVPEHIEVGWRLVDGEWTAPPVPAVVAPPLSRLEMMSRFTDAELAAIYTAAKADIAVEIWLDRFKLSEFIDVSDERTQLGLQLLVERGLLAAERTAELLA